MIAELTGAFGGRYHMTQPQYNQITEFYGRPIAVHPSDRPQDILAKVRSQYDVLHEAEYCLSIANELDELGLITSSANPRHPVPDGVFPLDDGQFKSFLNTLNRERVRRGEWGQWAYGLTHYLRTHGKRPDFREYSDLQEEIYSNLKPIPFIPKFLEAISLISWLGRDIDAATPSTSVAGMGLQVIFQCAGYVATCLANYLGDSVHVKLWGCSVPKHLCKQWRDIRYRDKPAE